MIFKLCGIKTKNNFGDLDKVDIDMVGLNFYPQSPRFVEDNVAMADLAEAVPKSIKKVGVFVNEDLAEVEWRAASFGLDYLQLHGDEDIDYCQAAKQFAKIIKVFKVDDDFDFATTTPFESLSSFFLFDTPSPDHGGSGESFDWSKLADYQGQTKFILAGGIGPDDVDKVKGFSHPAFHGVDLNSKFEFAVANKHMREVYDFVSAVKKA
jgi:phosphoribosylanthranilate isomerase